MGFEKTLVLKRILPHLAEDPAFVEMFLGEAKLAAMLEHPKVVELTDGLCAKLVASAAEGLAYAHEFCDPATGEPLGRIHRDVSPDNILVSRQGAVKVVDFGIAKEVAPGASSTGFHAGASPSPKRGRWPGGRLPRR